MCTPAPRSSGASTARRSRSIPDRRSSSRRSSDFKFDKPALARRRADAARRATSSGPSRGRCRASCSTARSSAGFGPTCPRTRSSPAAPATSPAGCTGTSATRAFAPSSARRTARWATAIRRRVGAKLAEPKRTVIALCGDGDFLMNGQELATAVQYGANFVALVVNNGLYGTIRMHQEREYPGRVFGTDLQEPGFRRLCARLRRARRDGGAHGGLRAGVRARVGIGQAGAHRAEDRSGRDHSGDDPFGHPREGAYVKAMNSGSAWWARSNLRKS